MEISKYTKFNKIDLPNRTWPNNEIIKAPIWCSVDLRDGNQALINPMTLEKKIHFFNLLVKMGFKEIEVGFPSASKVEYKFIRYLIENDMIPDDVRIQILTQAREELIRKSAESLAGAKNITIHMYNPTSTMQREVVYNKSKEEIKQIAIQGVKWIKKYFTSFEGNIMFEYTPESFTQTELSYAIEVCNAVVDTWEPKEDEKVIINLPSTVESATPNIYADQIEYMHRHIKKRENILISVHAHNDRGCAVAATELALMAGADRVEGTLLGNGERTGNVDIVTLGLNMFTQGIDPKLDFSNVDNIVKVVEASNEIKTHVRHPYVGDLVYTAFSGSHQDAINKGMAKQGKNSKWYVPYLPIDPKDVGRDYEAIIQINSQSGKGGVSYILESNFGYKVPKQMEIPIGKSIQKISDTNNGIVSNTIILETFENNFVNKRTYYSIENINIKMVSKNVYIEGDFTIGSAITHMSIQAKGIIEAISSIYNTLGVDFDIVDYSEHTLGQGSEAKAAAYFAIEIDNDMYYGAGTDKNITYASINALVSSLNVAYNSKETNHWNPKTYNKHTAFVSQLALPVVDLLDPKKGERILDVGCGDGTLAVEMEHRGAKVIGIDMSTEMVKACKDNGIEAYVGSVTDLPYENEFDRVFSNAMLHWVKDSRSAVQNIFNSLKKGGCFICEFGGEGNAYHLVSAMQVVFANHPEFGDFDNPWYFPSVEEYTKLLESEGFSVEYIEIIPRPTPMEDIGNWLDIFANGVTSHLSVEQYEVFKKEVMEILKNKIYSEKEGWVLDYMRLRMKAVKK